MSEERIELMRAVKKAIDSMTATVQAFGEVIEAYENSQPGFVRQEYEGRWITEEPINRESVTTDDRYRPGMIWQSNQAEPDKAERVRITYAPDDQGDWAYFTNADGSGNLRSMLKGEFEQRYYWVYDSTLEWQTIKREPGTLRPGETPIQYRVGARWKSRTSDLTVRVLQDRGQTVKFADNTSIAHEVDKRGFEEHYFYMGLMPKQDVNIKDTISRAKQDVNIRDDDQTGGNA